MAHRNVGASTLNGVLLLRDTHYGMTIEIGWQFQNDHDFCV